MKRLDAVSWIVLGTLGLAAAGLLWVGVGVVKRSDPAAGRGDFGYQRMLASVDELMALTGEAAVLELQVVDTVLRGRRLRYDTLVVSGHPADVPSLGRGGFLYDEVRRYNAFQRERAALSLVDYDAFERLRPYNPSIFRPTRRGDGSPAVTRTAAAWNRRVQSPFDDEWFGVMRASDAAAGWGLYSPYATISFLSPRAVTRKVEGRLQACEFESGEQDAFAYCLSEARRPQAVFRDALTERGASRLLAGWNPLRLDGERIAPGDSAAVAPGSVLRLAPLEPVVLGEHREGMLSSRQWVNGRMRRRGLVDPPLDWLAPLGRRPIDPADPPSPDADVALSVDLERSRDLTDELRTFADRLPIELEFGTVVLTRVPDGAILAVAEVGSRSEPGRSRLLERVAPGSAVKPLLAAAVLSERPDLASLSIPARSGVVTRVLNAPPIPSRNGFTSTLNCGDGGPARVDLRDFLRCSNNEYAASLLIAGLTEPHGRIERTVERSILLRSAVTEGISTLYGLSTDPVIADSLGRSGSIWADLRFTDGKPVRVPFEVLPDGSRPALLSSGSREATDLSLLYRYAYGAWENRWNLFDLTTAFARVTTDRRIQATFVSGGVPGVPPRAPPDLGLSGHEWYGPFLRGLSDVGRSGTGRGLSTSWSRAGLPGTVYVKTGTLAESDARRGEGLFIKALLFGVGESGGRSSAPLECGVVGAVYLNFAEGPASGSLPSYQLDFAETGLARFLSRNWERFDVCPEDGPGTG